MPRPDTAIGSPRWWVHESPRREWWRHGVATAEIAPGGEAAPIVADDSVAAFVGVLAFTFVLLMSPQSTITALAPLRLAFVSVMASLAALLLYRLGHGQSLGTMTRETWIAAALAAWAVVTLPWSAWPTGALSFLLQIYFKSLVIFWLLLNTLVTRTRIRRIAWALTAMSVPLAIAGVRHFLIGDFLGDEGRRAGRIAGFDAPLTSNPNDLALMLNLLLPLAVALLLMTRRPMVRLALAGAIALDVAGVFATYSRGGFVTLAAILLVYLWKFRGRPERRWAWGLVGGLLALVLVGLPLLLPVSYLDRLNTITDIKADTTGSAEARWSDAWAALRVISRHPIVGAGPGQNILALNDERGARWKEIHNVYLEYAVDLGLPGLALFVTLWALSLGATALVQRESRGRPGSSDLFYLAEGVQVSLIAFAVAGMVHPVAYHFHFYYMAGLALAIREVWRAEQGAAGAGLRAAA